MRHYGMYDASRGLTLALAAALAGLGLWGAAKVGTQTPGRFWIAMAIVGAAGLVITLANHVGTWTKGLRLRVSPSTFALAFLPVLVCVGWILLASQPGNGWEEGRIHSWSNTIGILGVVHSASGAACSRSDSASCSACRWTACRRPQWTRKPSRRTPAPGARLTSPSRQSAAGAQGAGGRLHPPRRPGRRRRRGAGRRRADEAPIRGRLKRVKAAADPCREGSR